MIIFRISFCFFLFCHVQTFAQHPIHANSFQTKEHSIRLDGKLDEEVWRNLEPYGDFHQQFPRDSVQPTFQTTVKSFYDKQHLYFGIYCQDTLPQVPYTVQSLKRDFNLGQSDVVAVFLDPFGNKSNGFTFGTNTAGVQYESLQQNGGVGTDIDAWDNRWFVEVSTQPDGWTIEMKIPFKSIRFNPEKDTWYLNFLRFDLKNNERSVWSPVPLNISPSNMTYYGELIFSDGLPKQGKNISIIPYGLRSVNRTLSGSLTSRANAGVDAKIAVSTGLNLDITVNPDFSQAEVDDQITNLSRFSLFFPERRQFFLENSDLFDQFGNNQIRPFFSRRIGLEQGQTIPIRYGIRLSGQLSPKWRLGILNMQTGETSNNFSAVALQRKVGKASNLSALLTNRMRFEGGEIDSKDNNQVLAIDYNLQSEDGKNIGKFFIHNSLTPNGNDAAFSTAYTRNQRNFTAIWRQDYVGRDFRADIGFIPRLANYDLVTDSTIFQSYWRFNPSFQYKFYPKNRKLNIIQPGLTLNHFYDTNFQNTEQNTTLNLSFFFKNLQSFGFAYDRREVLLLFPTDVTFSGNTPLPAGRYSWSGISGGFNSSPIPIFTYQFSFNYSKYYEGERLGLSGQIGFRVEPKLSLNLIADYNQIQLPMIDVAAQFTLLRTRIEYQFNKNWFVTFVSQYNTQSNQFTNNFRLQYRFKPMSDIFLVYNDNYSSDGFRLENRGLFLKIVW